MKRILALWLAALMLAAQPSQAVVCVGFGQSTPASEWDIEDDFSSNTAANYTRISGTGTISIASGVARTLNYNATVYYQHNTDLGTDNQMVQAVMCDGLGTLNKSGVLIRSNGTTAHGCVVNGPGNRIDCDAIGGSGTTAYLTFASSAWADGACHLVRITTNSSDLYSLFVDFNDDGDFADANETAGTATNSSYTGTYTGIAWKYAALADDVYVDDFKAKAND